MRAGSGCEEWLVGRIRRRTAILGRRAGLVRSDALRLADPEVVEGTIDERQFRDAWDQAHRVIFGGPAALAAVQGPEVVR
ncbi:MAG: hypothetical protein NZ898_01330 [Myxococcota bacterium]|nr:hypothetical protein [Myxococcota bacterium]MDW8360763.1 hypothetical protein [Myxococcales bacterium]